ncbi:hypothetical protein [Paracoccus sp. T5]|uniref:hypothetical protein n=1 Tax=Paracoccus sp. T5 TaxID=3402161 RepID=UPI003AE17DD2
MRMLKLLVVLILAALIGLAGYAYFGDLTPTRTEVRRPLDPAAAPAATPAPAPATDAEPASD